MNRKTASSVLYAVLVFVFGPWVVLLTFCAFVLISIFSSIVVALVIVLRVILSSWISLRNGKWSWWRTQRKP